jgi:hypothetical protein
MYKTEYKLVPLHINSEVRDIRIIANWRLEIGK